MHLHIILYWHCWNLFISFQIDAMYKNPLDSTLTLPSVSMLSTYYVGNEHKCVKCSDNNTKKMKVPGLQECITKSWRRPKEIY